MGKSRCGQEGREKGFGGGWEGAAGRHKAKKTSLDSAFPQNISFPLKDKSALPQTVFVSHSLAAVLPRKQQIRFLNILMSDCV